MSRVKEHQKYMIEWIKAHLAELKSEQFLLEFEGDEYPSTNWFGIMQKCSYCVEELVELCIANLSCILGDGRAAIIDKVGNGKPLNRFTLGQRVQLLQELDQPVSAVLKQQYPQVMPK